MANKKRLIDANALHASVSKKLMTDVFPNWKEFPRDVQEKLTRLGKEHERFLFEAPTVDAVEVVHGWWDKYEDEKFMGYDANGRIQYRKVYIYYCGRCGRGTAVKTNYCPNCGADMRERKDND